MGTGQSEQRSGRNRRTLHRRDMAVAQSGRLGRNARATARGELWTAASATGSNPETGRWRAGAGDPDRARPADPAGIAASAHAVVRPAVLELVVRFSAEEECASSASPGQGVRERRT